MAIEFSSEEVKRAAEIVGVRVLPEDLAAVTEALAAHYAFVEPLLRRDLSDVDPALTFDPRWRD